MSCFIVGKRTIDDAVSLLIQKGVATPDTADATGRALWLMNIDAYSQRYAHIPEAVAEAAEARKEVNAYVHEDVDRSPEQLIKSLNALVYNSAEGDVTEREFFKLLDELSNKLATDEITESAAYVKGYWGD
jgi:hypothetical protein